MNQMVQNVFNDYFLVLLRPYMILTSTSFDPFISCTNYMELWRKYIENKVLIRDSLNANTKLFRNRFNQSESKPIIFVDFTQIDKENEEKKENTFNTMFHSYMVAIEWDNNIPYVQTVLSKSDTSPCPQLIPCRSLYWFVESSLIGQKQELKKLKLFSRIGVFAFKYFELYTLESIKLRKQNTQQNNIVINNNENEKLKDEIIKEKPIKNENNNNSITMASYLYPSHTQLEEREQMEWERHEKESNKKSKYSNNITIQQNKTRIKQRRHQSQPQPQPPQQSQAYNNEYHSQHQRSTNNPSNSSAYHSHSHSHSHKSPPTYMSPNISSPQLAMHHLKNPFPIHTQHTQHTQHTHNDNIINEKIMSLQMQLDKLQQQR